MTKTADYLSIYLLNGLRIELQGEPVAGFVSRKADALLIYLVCVGHPVSRETAAFLLWGDQPQARALANLSVALSSLRKQLASFITADRHTIALNPERKIWVDAVEFEDKINAVRKQQQRQDGRLYRANAAQLAQAAALYQGDFLAGFTVRDAPDFDEWTMLERERLQLLALEGLSDLAFYYQTRGQFRLGIAQANRVLACDPLREEAHRQLMTLLALEGQRAVALAQYEICCQILADELGVEPDEETTALYEQIREGTMEMEPERVTPAVHNIPVQTTPFVGRQVELAQISKRLDDPACRLLTLLGPGGIGKTRLVQQAARGEIGEFLDGVWLVSLASLVDVRGLAPAIADAIDFYFSGPSEPQMQLVNHLKEKEALLILDNFEHLLTDSSLQLLTDIMAHAPEVKLLATSRERLNLQAEALVVLAGLPYPRQTDLPALATYPAVQLFVQRAQQIRPNFELTKDHETAVIRICQLVDGLPLALELAAAWIRALPVAGIAAEIERGLDFLASPLHDLPDRHRSLRAVFDSAWQMLTSMEQEIYRRLSVFRGGFTREAAQEVVGATLPVLLSLADKSLMHRDEDSRYRRHPLLVQFATEKLAQDTGERQAAQDRHAQYFADFLQRREARLQGGGMKAALDEIRVELDNLRAAWRRSISGQRFEVAIAMLIGLYRLYDDRAWYLEAIDLLQWSLTVVRQASSSAARSTTEARLLAEMGHFQYQTGRYQEAETTLEAGIGLARTANVPPALMDSLHKLGLIANERGDTELGRSQIEEALALAQESQDQEKIGAFHNSLGVVATAQGDYDAARRHYSEGMTIARSLGDKLRTAFSLNNLGTIANRLEDYEESKRLYQEAHQLLTELNHRWGMAATAHNIGMALDGLGEYKAGLKQKKVALELHREIGHQRGIVGGLSQIGTSYFHLGDFSAARSYLRQSLEMQTDMDLRWSALATVVDWAKMDMRVGKLEQAAAYLTLVAEHSATTAASRQDALELLDELKAELAPSLFEVAQQNGRLTNLPTLLKEIVDS